MGDGGRQTGWKPVATNGYGDGGRQDACPTDDYAPCPAAQK